MSVIVSRKLFEFLSSTQTWTTYDEIARTLSSFSDAEIFNALDFLIRQRGIDVDYQRQQYRCNPSSVDYFKCKLLLFGDDKKNSTSTTTSAQRQEDFAPMHDSDQDTSEEDEPEPQKLDVIHGEYDWWAPKQSYIALFKTCKILSAHPLQTLMGDIYITEASLASGKKTFDGHLKQNGPPSNLTFDGKVYTFKSHTLQDLTPKNKIYVHTLSAPSGETIWHTSSEDVSRVLHWHPFQFTFGPDSADQLSIDELLVKLGTALEKKFGVLRTMTQAAPQSAQEAERIKLSNELKNVNRKLMFFQSGNYK